MPVALTAESRPSVDVVQPSSLDSALSISNPRSAPQSSMDILRIELPGHRSYDIVVGQDNIGELGHHVAARGLGDSIFLISSPRIYGLYGDVVERSLRQGGALEIEHHLVPDGEKHKNLAEWQRAFDHLCDFDDGANKRVLIANLGGGVVGDLGGYVAATYRRGVDYIQIPTTLLGNVDCGIGGKVGVNHAKGKNLIGHFYQPRLVFSDLSFLRSLDRAELLSGLAEVIKYGVIGEPDLFSFLEEDSEKLLSLERDALRRVVLRCYSAKAGIVERDETDEGGIRAILNYGHTIGHALEAATDYCAWRHGEAVAIGMVCEAEIASSMGLLDHNARGRIEALIAKVGLPTHLPRMDPSRILECMSHDKKFVGGVNRFILPTGIGSVRVVEDIDEGLIRRVIEESTRSNGPASGSAS